MNKKVLMVTSLLLFLMLFCPGLGYMPVNYGGKLYLTGSNGVFAGTADEENNIAIYREYAPGVVNIISTAITWDFFLNPIPKEGTGSGSIIDKRGHILTNYHVVKGAKRLEVTMGDGSKWPGEVVGTDRDTDLAVIRVDAPRDLLRVIPMGDSSGLKVGQKVLAIGNPFGLERSLTTGIISSLGRKLKTEDGLVFEDVIQMDAAINPGNSGGPLLNSNGRMIGINTAIFSPTGGNIGIGFAVPVNTAKLILPELVSKGYVARPWMGVTIQTLVPEFAKILGLAADRGAMVIEVIPGGPAFKAGLIGGSRRVQIGNFILTIGGDIITEVDGLEVETTDQLMRYVGRLKPGREVELAILRRNRIKKVTLILSERPGLN